eukprot:NODE_9335_length_649_cov_44.332700_g9069_i0.p1 GENE.NODE_9335_length_649_cov_44.332700_g9069_i0~~NODE_9335_length_649_cov_44.332700_g9069_i0.p1  ORF type:complete len:175 (+),score=17.56 NODE_9335_length_649_cov_44.332700_g9069_i0:52-576(+)
MNIALLGAVLLLHSIVLTDAELAKAGSTCRKLVNQTTCLNTPECGWCLPINDQPKGPYCYHKPTESCCDPQGDCIGMGVPICERKTETCCPAYMDCEYAASPICCNKTDTCCITRHGSNCCPVGTSCCGQGYESAFPLCCNSTSPVCCTGGTTSFDRWCCGAGTSCGPTSGICK